MRGSRFGAGLLLLLLVLIITLKSKLLFGWTPDILISLLVAFGMIFSLYEVIFFSGLAIWILNWQPWPGRELGLLFALALVSYFGRFFMPWQRWVSVVFLTAGGIVGFYALSVPGALSSNWSFIFWDALFSVLFTFFFIRVFRYFYGRA